MAVRYWGIWHVRSGAFFTDSRSRLIYYPSKAIAQEAMLRMFYPPSKVEVGDIEVREFLELDDEAIKERMG